MRKLLFWLTSHLPCRIIAEEGSVYLERYYLFTLLGWRFYLHRFVGSDPDRGLHDHPWSRAFSIILAGWYWEQTRSGTRKVRWLNTLTGDTFHRVVLPSEGFVRGLPFLHPDFNKDAPCWTPATMREATSGVYFVGRPRLRRVRGALMDWTFWTTVFHVKQAWNLLEVCGAGLTTSRPPWSPRARSSPRGGAARTRTAGAEDGERRERSSTRRSAERAGVGPAPGCASPTASARTPG